VDVALSSAGRPASLTDWAGHHGLRVTWQRGQNWAGVTGSSTRMAEAFGTPIHEYRSPDGVEFYAAPQDIAVPAALRGSVLQVGHLVGYRKPVIRTIPSPGLHTDVPPDGIGPKQALALYQATSLAQAGFTGKGDTVVFFEWSPPNQSDLDAFSSKAGLSKISPVNDGSFADSPGGAAILEATMDFEDVHAIAPDAKLVAVDAGPTFHANDAHTVGENIAQMFTQTASKYPDSVWSSSIGWFCSRDVNQADLLPIQNALQAAHGKGITAYDASGDTDGLECKENSATFSAPPKQSDVGVDAIASLPAMTSVGGTHVSVDNDGNWVAEQTWVDSTAQQGTGGGLDINWPRPDWQKADGVADVGDTTHRLVPDVSADADPSSGLMMVSDGEVEPGGGTSQAAPIWAALTVLMNEYLRAHGGHSIGDINPLLYRIARGAAKPAFHDVTLGGNAVFLAGPGYDPVTGLGSPNAANLAADLLDLQKGGSS
jgi:kumamolisin